jgi:hypothetical protein
MWNVWQFHRFREGLSSFFLLSALLFTRSKRYSLKILRFALASETESL